MTAKELYREISKESGVSLKDTEAVYKALTNVVIEAINSDEETKLTLPALGTIRISVTEPRPERDPRTGQLTGRKTPSKRRATFSFSKNVRDSLN